MSSPQIITGPPCRACGKPVSDSIKRHFGNPAAGYTCPACVVKQNFAHAGYRARLTAESERATLGSLPKGAESGCAICGQVTTVIQSMVWIDGGYQGICATMRPGETECERKYFEKNRQLIGPVLQHSLKLK